MQVPARSDAEAVAGRAGGGRCWVPRLVNEAQLLVPSVGSATITIGGGKAHRLVDLQWQPPSRLFDCVATCSRWGWTVRFSL